MKSFSAARYLQGDQSSQKASSFSALLISITLLASLSGCALDYELHPDTEGERVTITIKVSEGLAPPPMAVGYRSTICENVYEGPDVFGNIREQRVAFKRRGEGNFYDGDFAVEGGGMCRWRVAYVNFGVRPQWPERIGEGAIVGTGGDVLVLFQDTNPNVRPEVTKNVVGTRLDIKNNYYPWLKNVLKKDYVKRVNLVGEAMPYPTYLAPQVRNIYFEAVLHDKYAVASTEPEFKGIGIHPAFIYPDGTSGPDDSDTPDFPTLEAIRLKAESNP
jgi:signal peptidase I